MVSIRDKLKRLDPENRKKQSPGESADKKETGVARQSETGDKRNVEIAVPGGIVKNDFGSFFCRRKNFDLAYRNGYHRLGVLNKLRQKVDPAENIFAAHTAGCSLEDFLFLDTETTGLAGGTGTIPFMVGLGYFASGEFIVEQLFMRDFEEEAGLLCRFQELVRKHPVIISFNGKTFDFPLLSTRLVLNRMQEVEIKYHLDLLYPSRRVWSYLDSCSLSSLESHILGVKRKEDIPGSEVPQVYFDYLNHGETGKLRKVFEHNLIDIVSLVTLFTHLISVHRKDEAAQREAEEYYNLGRIYEKEKKISKSIFFYEQAREEAGTYLLSEIEKRLSWQYKRADRWREAAEIWETMISSGRGGIFPYRELAKYLEHRQKEYRRAEKYVEKALSLLRERRAIITDYEGEKGRLEHRLERLRGKTMRLF
ncbi:MAG: ribonuclease H-like domain-containing protein [Halanaerobiaceae bacterium]